MALVLDEVQVKDLVSGERRLTYAELDDSLESALRVLAERNILAVPVRERSQHHNGGAAQEQHGQGQGQEHTELTFCGQLSVLDIAAFVAKCPERISEGTKVEGAEEVKVGEAMRKTAESWHMLLLDPHASVGRAMDFLGARGFHRALVPNTCLCSHAPEDIPMPVALVEEMPVGAQGEECRVLAQMDLARFVLEHEGRFGLALAQTVDAVGLGGSRVLGTTKGEKLSSALARLAQHAVSALAVVDKLETNSAWALPNALLFDTLSASDLRGCSLSELSRAQAMTVDEFLSQQRQHSPRNLLTCTKSSSLRSVLTEMVQHGVHRLWLIPEAEVGTAGEPLPVHGVITLSDAIRVLRVLPVTNNSGDEGFVDAEGQLLWMDWTV